VAGEMGEGKGMGRSGRIEGKGKLIAHRSFRKSFGDQVEPGPTVGA